MKRIIFVREHIPLEQGLRLRLTLWIPYYSSVREHIPLEQGLRHFRVYLFVEGFLSQRAYSIRTRIKTDAESVIPVID